MSAFKSTNDFRLIVSQLHKEFSWEVLKPMTEQACHAYVTRYLSKEFVAQLEALVGTTIADEAVSTAVDLFRHTVACYTYMDLLLTQSVKVADRGVQESVSDDGTSRPASHYTRNDARLFFSQRADEYLDDLLKHLEATVVDDPTAFETWQDSEAYKELFSCFIWSYDQMKNYIQGIKSRRILYAIRAQIMWVQQRDLQPLLGDQFDTLIDAIRNRPDTALTQEQEDLIKMIQPWLAAQSFLEAIPSLRLQFREGGIHYLTYDGPVTKSLESAADAGVRHLQSQLEGKAAGAWTALTKWIDKHADAYPGITISGEEQTDGTYQRKARIHNSRGSISL